MLFEDPIPLYYQIENILKERVLSGEYGIGELFPTEVNLCKEFNVSRITIRKALLSLAQDGLIIRRRGKGTTVTNLLGREEPTRLTGFLEDIIAIGIKSTVKLLAFDFVKPPKVVMEGLRLSHDQYPLRVEKVRYIGQEPFSHVVNFVPPWITEKIRPEAVQEIPMLQIFERDLHMQIAKGLQCIWAVISDTKLSAFLNVRIGAPLMRIERTVYDVRDRPVEYVVTHYRGDRYSYSVSLKRLLANTKGNGRWLVSQT